ncbi:MAG: hypothetical protein E7621_01705 [Ruminococcaceae bacterium]|nr:hypothetical protein [Oscillospiraceae bacterium]
METRSREHKNLSDEKLYTAEDLENIVETRLSRERKNNESLIKVREALGMIRKEEGFKNLSNAKIAQKLSELAVSLSADKTPVGEDNGTDAVPDAQKADNEGGADGNYISEKEKRLRELSEFAALYGEEKLGEVMEDKMFRSFCKRREGDLVTLFEDYCIFLAGMENAKSAAHARAAQRGLASTGFSGYAAGTPDYASLLTENQKRIAASAGMSYKQYSEFLSQIPSKKIGK